MGMRRSKVRDPITLCHSTDQHQHLATGLPTCRHGQSFGLFTWTLARILLSGFTTKSTTLSDWRYRHTDLLLLLLLNNIPNDQLNISKGSLICD